MSEGRKHIRLKNHDYSLAGSYFITICTKQKEPYFGEIINNTMALSEIGKIVNEYILEIPTHFKNVKLDEYVIMPNHIHCIFFLYESPVGTRHVVSSINNENLPVGTSHVMSPANNNDKSVGSSHVMTLTNDESGPSYITPQNHDNNVGSPHVMSPTMNDGENVEDTTCRVPTNNENLPVGTSHVMSGTHNKNASVGSPHVVTSNHDNINVGSPHVVTLTMNNDENIVSSINNENQPIGSPHVVTLQNDNDTDSRTSHVMTLQKKNAVNQFAKPVPGSVSVIIQQFKSSVKRWCNQNNYSHFQWQSRFHDHVIRDEKSYWDIKKYIYNNVANWKEDSLNQKNQKAI